MTSTDGMTGAAWDCSAEPERDLGVTFTACDVNLKNICEKLVFLEVIEAPSDSHKLEDLKMEFDWCLIQQCVSVGEIR